MCRRCLWQWCRGRLCTRIRCSAWDRGYLFFNERKGDRSADALNPAHDSVCRAPWLGSAGGGSCGRGVLSEEAADELWFHAEVFDEARRLREDEAAGDPPGSAELRHARRRGERLPPPGLNPATMAEDVARLQAWDSRPSASRLGEPSAGMQCRNHTAQQTCVSTVQTLRTFGTLRKF